VYLTAIGMSESRIDPGLVPIWVALVLRDETVLPGLRVRSYVASLPRRSTPGQAATAQVAVRW
jgi:hypothetical protein